MRDALAFQTARKLQDTGRFDEARKTYRQILARNPKHFESHAQLALMDFAQGRFQDALKENERALKLRPDVPGLHNNAGSILLALGRFKDAAARFEQAVRLDPKDAQARNNLGGAFSKLGRLQEALACVDAALTLAPTYAKAHSDRAMVLTRLGRLTDAVESAGRAIALQPDLAEARDHRGVALLQLGRNGEALEAFDAAVAADPGFAPAHGNRGVVLEALGREDEALASFRRALTLDPDTLLAAGPAVQLRMRNCDWDGLEAEVAAILARIDAGALASPPFSVLPLTDSPARQKKAAALYSALISPLRVPDRVSTARAEKIRVGYFSPDFADHPVGHAIAGVLERHDRTRFEITAFLLTPLAPDKTQTRLRAAVDRFVDVSGMSDPAAAGLAREFGLDVAVDLAGYTNHSRPGIFAYGAAPTQVAWLGYPGTLGNEAIPYLIADAFVIPEALRTNYTEKIVTLPDCFFPTDDRRPIGPTPSRADAGLPASGFVFCAFNSAAKITPAVFDIWMRILGRVRHSVLWLAVRGATAQRNLRAEATRRGIDPERLVFAPHADSAAHLARQRQAGLFLDTYPFGAHSTAADALQAGLPVLTMPGEAFANRVAASLVASLNMFDLIARDWAEYERKAVEIAEDAELALRLKETLDANLKTRPTFDTGRFTRALEGAYTALAERAAAGKAPESFSVPDGGI